MKAGIVIDEWKLPIFDRRLTQAGYTFKNAGLLTAGTLVLQVETTNPEALGEVVKAANTEAAMAYRNPEPATTLLDGSPVTPDHRDINPATGMQNDYIVLSAEERAKGFVRPVRRSYLHGKCGAVTTMGVALAETYAREPRFYSGTFCVVCRAHFPVGADGDFTWDGTTEKVGT